MVIENEVTKFTKYKIEKADGKTDKNNPICKQDG
jgi:hypothetical protein